MVAAALRHQRFFSFHELNLAIREKLREFSRKPYQKKDGCMEGLSPRLYERITNPFIFYISGIFHIIPNAWQYEYSLLNEYKEIFAALEVSLHMNSTLVYFPGILQIISLRILYLSPKSSSTLPTDMKPFSFKTSHILLFIWLSLFSDNFKMEEKATFILIFFIVFVTQASFVISVIIGRSECEKNLK
ncbi:hypothetical protein CLHUN_03650 [Ruminiclostridium hungatei]|uniref:Uncharacterized protein n=1 Tax=Ruminiclostridium hungatei TaxID=48256 RepID=A0A1V4SPV5_RUMHU|nr:hypothetical protein CLHUN_03650 [Ruminiclostridium hungatei]